jgi:Flp pilus assembly secretin CpaC
MMARAWALGMGAVLLAASLAETVAKEPIAVMIDRAKVMRISAPAETIIIGNPAIADATVYDRQTIVVTGKMVGQTNLIILDAKGQPIADEMVAVQRAVGNVVSVQKGATVRHTFNCTPDCAPALESGDDLEFFSKSNTQANQRNTASAGQAAQ